MRCPFWEPLRGFILMGIGFEGKFRPTVRAAKLAFNDIRPAPIIFHVSQVGKCWKFHNSPIVHERAQPAEESGQLPGG
jgi:hypothetical protein